MKVEIVDEDPSIGAQAKRHWTLDQLMENMTPRDMREAFDWGEDAGRERVDD